MHLGGPTDARRSTEMGSHIMVGAMRPGMLSWQFCATRADESSHFIALRA